MLFPTPDLPTRDVLVDVLAALQRYVSLTTAQSVLSVARQRGGYSGTQITRDQLAALLAPIERSLSFFLGDAVRAMASRRAQESLTAPPTRPPASSRRVLSIKIRVEDD